ncbi:MAG: hypothetical protein IJ532_05545 [Alphaproteobacteria bacterium]|nr:hypothetical protein [Alphaproteobacteria bacterium]
MKKFMLFFAGAVAVACVFAGCGQYGLTFTNSYSPYFFNARNPDLNYRLDYCVKKSVMDSVNKDTTKKVHLAPWVPYGYRYPY